MFSCSACLCQAFRSLALDLHRSRGLPSTVPHSLISFRSHATLQSLRKGHHRRDAYKALKRNQKVQLAEGKLSNKRVAAARHDALAREHNRTRLLNDGGSTQLSKAMRLESRFLTDPLKLAQSVVEKLRNSEFDAALTLVRASEKALDGRPVENTVSWNHIIDWLMNQEQPGMAWRIYNEMKKRGHKPDAHTYTIMLRGYRDNIKKPNAVKQAVDIYNSMYAANSAVTPATIHTNAVLSVCARGHDIDALWTIAGRLPDRGPGAPDHATFTTILQAINAEARMRAEKFGSRQGPDGPDYDPQPIFEEVVEDARKLWVDITARWRKGDLQLDEALVCAMGRLLMLSTDVKRHEDVLNLVDQAMNIPRFSGSSGSTSEEAEDLAVEPISPSQEARSLQKDVPAMRTSSTWGRASDAFIYARPGNNTLSMLLETTAALRYARAGRYYWELLTSSTGSYQIVPDSQNVAAYLRLLRVSRASQAAMELLSQPRSGIAQDKVMTRGNFTIAMSTCLRDKNNPNVFTTANRILDLMQNGAKYEDGNESLPSQGQKLRIAPKVLSMYLQLAIATTKGLNGTLLKKTANGDLDFERSPQKNHTLRALARLGPEMLNVKRLIKLHTEELEQQATVYERTVNVQKLLTKREITPYNVQESMEDLMAFLKALISAYDKILLMNERLEDEGMGPLDTEVVSNCWTQKRKLSAFVGKVDNPAGIRKYGQEQRGRGMPKSNPLSDNSQGRTEEEPDMDADDLDEQGLDLTVPNQRIRVLETIQSEHKRMAKSGEETRLSRRQKHELGKAERIRQQFPVSMLRPEKNTKGAHVSKSHHGETRGPRRQYTKNYSGWGGGFEALAREKNPKTQTGVLDFGP